MSAPAAKKSRVADLQSLPRSGSVDLPGKPVSIGNTSSLAIVGGSSGEAKRAESLKATLQRLAGEKLPDHAVFHPDDLIWASDDLCFVGEGVHSNILGIRYALSKDVIHSRRIAVVHDYFDRTQEHGALTAVFRLITDDVTVMLESIIVPPRRRLVSEYVRGEEGEYVLARHDVDFAQYVHENGYRIVPIQDQTKIPKYLPSDIPVQQSSNHVLMVAPTAFESNIQAAQDNHFMAGSLEGIASSPAELQRKVLKEFSALHSIIANKAKVQVHLFTHEPHHDTPDACFPNNWFSTHTNLEVGECTLVLYPMKAPNRRKERRPEFINRLMGFRRYTRVVDLTNTEHDPKPTFLEGTGSIVLDRIRRVAYVAISERSDRDLADRWARELGYRVVAFCSTDAAGRPIYHTNVMMCVGTKVAIVCAESVEDPKEREELLASLRAHHAVVEITRKQVEHFCGNVLELEDWRGRQVLVMSTQAFRAFTPAQRALMLQYEHELLHADISTIEKIGGGGVRCTLAELF